MYTLTILEADYDVLCAHLFATSAESAAYLLCGLSATNNETRLLVREVIPVAPEEIDESSATHMQIQQSSFLRAMKRASDQSAAFLFVHSHPRHVPGHSAQDDRTERTLFRTAYVRVHTPGAVHGSIVISTPAAPVGRVWLSGGGVAPIDKIRVIGNRFRFSTSGAEASIDLDIFSRQVLAFGENLQKLLRKLTIGVVGAGGTGSAVAEQLVRLGVGRLLVADGDALESSNVTRVYGSRIDDVGTNKAEIVKRHGEEMGLGVVIEALPDHISKEAVAKRFRECDIVFCCVDRERGRALLQELALRYLIPVFDLGVRIMSDDGTVRAAEGRVTTLLPGAACLFCRERISGDVLAAEALAENDPEEYERLRKQRYIPELEGHAPAVIPFTSAIASFAVNELIHRLSGYMGEDRTSTELFVLFDDSRISRNSTGSVAACHCASRRYRGRGDGVPFLGLTWHN